MTSTPEIRTPIITGLMRWCGALAVLAVLAPGVLRAEDSASIRRRWSNMALST